LQKVLKLSRQPTLLLIQHANIEVKNTGLDPAKIETPKERYKRAIRQVTKYMKPIGPDGTHPLYNKMVYTTSLMMSCTMGN
jgi:hypothetical protein